MSPRLDLRVPPKEAKLPLAEAQAHRHFSETHLPAGALRFSPNAKYVHISRVRVRLEVAGFAVSTLEA